MLPKAEKVSYRALLSMDLSRFLMNTLPTPDFLREGSLWDHMILIGFPFTTSKFMVSRALSAGGRSSTEVEGKVTGGCMHGAVTLKRFQSLVHTSCHASVLYCIVSMLFILWCNHDYNAAIAFSHKHLLYIYIITIEIT